MTKLLFILLLLFGCFDEYSPIEQGHVHGCLDSQACNYNSDATIDNNSCIYPIGYPTSNYDCEGNCLEWLACYDSTYDGFCLYTISEDTSTGEEWTNYNELCPDSEMNSTLPNDCYFELIYSIFGGNLVYPEQNLIVNYYDGHYDIYCMTCGECVEI